MKKKLILFLAIIVSDIINNGNYQFKQTLEMFKLK
jgi:hypothetical protein